MISVENLAEISAIVSNASSRLTSLLGEQVELRIIKPHVRNVFYDVSQQEANRQLDISNIINVVCEEFEITVKELRSGDRRRVYADARKVAASLLRGMFADINLKRIGDAINCDHSTVLYNIKMCEELLQTDNKFIAHYENCKSAYYLILEESEVAEA